MSPERRERGYAERLLERLQGVRRGGSGWTAKCPGPAHQHGDRHPSLSVAEGDGGRILLKCHAGCATEDVLEALNLSEADLFEQRNGQPPTSRRIVATFDYRAAAGELLYQVVRYAPKDFRQRRPDGGGGWTWRIGGVARVPYQLPELLAADPSEPVYIPEGERHVDRLRGLGLVATCNVGGAGKWRPEYSQHLRGRRVVIVADNDAAGRNHARQVANALVGVAGSVRVLELPRLAEKGDIIDWLDAGGTPDELAQLARQTAERMDSPAVGAAQPEAGGYAPRLITLSDIPPEQVRWLWPRRVPFGKLTILCGDPGLGKSFITLDLAARLSSGTAWPDGGVPQIGSTVILTAEDGLADTVRPRLDAMGADVSRVTALTAVIDKSADGVELAFQLAHHLAVLEAAIGAVGAVLVILDPLNAFLAGVDSYKGAEVRGVLAPLAALADRTGAAIIVVHHLNKGASPNALYRAGGSLDFVAAARSVLGVAPDPENEPRRVLVTVKLNLAAHPPGLGYSIAEGAVAWDAEPVTLDASAAFSAGQKRDDGSEPTGRAEAEAFLREALADGRARVTKVRADAATLGIRDRTLDRAKAALNVEAEREGFGDAGCWYWRLPNAIERHKTLSTPVKNTDALRENWRSMEQTPAATREVFEL